MKFMLLIALFTTQLSFAETMRQKNIKNEMIKRVDVMIEKMTLARKALAKEKVVEACVLVEDLFKLYPEHVTDVGSYMDYSKKKNKQVVKASIDQLARIHENSEICLSGKDSENVDPKLMKKELGKMLLSLKRQKGIIVWGKADQDNDFSYEYEF